MKNSKVSSLLLQFHLALFISLFCFLPNQPKASAAAVNNNGNIPPALHVGDCSPRVHAQNTWASPVGTPTQSQIQVAQGQASFPVQINAFSAICTNGLDANQDVLASARTVLLTRIETCPFPTGSGVELNFSCGSQLSQGYDYNYRYASGPDGIVSFPASVTIPSNLPIGVHSLNVTYEVQAAHIFNNSTNLWTCITNNSSIVTMPRNLSSPDPFYGCPVFYRTTNLVVNIIPNGNPPVGYIDVADCSTVSGWAADLNDLSAPLTLHAYVNGQGPVGGVTNIYRQDVNNSIGGNGSHGFTIDFSSLIGPGQLDGGNYNVSVAAINASGGVYWLTTGSGSTTLTVPNCPPRDRPPDGRVDPYNPNPPVGTPSSTCDTLSGAASDPDRIGNISVDIYRDGNFETRVPTSGGLWSYGVSQYKDFVGHTFEAFARGVDRNGNENGVNPSIGKIVIGPCASVTCQSVTTIGLVEAGSTFKLRTGIDVTMGSSGAPYGMTARLNVVGATITPGALTQNNIQPGSTAPIFEWDVRIDNSGYYAGAIVFDVNGSTTTCAFGGYKPNCTSGSPGCVPVCPPGDPTCCPPDTCTPCLSGTDRCPLAVPVKPYFRVYGGNVVAGVTETTCEIGSVDMTNSPGRILAFSRGNGDGSGTQLIAQALNIIDGFSSAQGPAGNSSPDKGLGLSNTAGNPTYGGAFGSASCPDIPSTGETANSYTDPGTLATGEKKVIFVNGNVTISNNISYGGSPWASLEDIPSFTLVVTGGDIYIDNDVTELHGLFVAKPVGGIGGNIYTCTNGSAPYSETELITGADQNSLPCSSPLTVYGSFMAKQVKLLRTNGRTGSASNTHVWNTALTSQAAPAERFIYSPELWARSNGAGTTSETSTFDSLKPLPPVL